MQVEKGETKSSRFIECLDVLKKRQSENSDSHPPWFQIQDEGSGSKWSKHLVTFKLC